MAVASNVMVAMAEIHLIKGTGAFSCLGLGSCIGLAVLDPVAGIAAMAHVMLPEAFPDKAIDKPGKFADTAVPELLTRLDQAGAKRERLVCAICGGAQVFKFGGESSTRMEIGRRNAEAVIGHLKSRKLSLRAQEVGGSLGRTMIFTVETGDIVVRTVTQGEKKLCNLRA